MPSAPTEAARLGTQSGMWRLGPHDLASTRTAGPRFLRRDPGEPDDDRDSGLARSTPHLHAANLIPPELIKAARLPR